MHVFPVDEIKSLQLVRNPAYLCPVLYFYVILYNDSIPSHFKRGTFHVLSTSLACSGVGYSGNGVCSGVGYTGIGMCSGAGY